MCPGNYQLKLIYICYQLHSEKGQDSTDSTLHPEKGQDSTDSTLHPGKRQDSTLHPEIGQDFMVPSGDQVMSSILANCFIIAKGKHEEQNR